MEEDGLDGTVVSGTFSRRRVDGNRVDHGREVVARKGVVLQLEQAESRIRHGWLRCTVHMAGGAFCLAGHGEGERALQGGAGARVRVGSGVVWGKRLGQTGRDRGGSGEGQGEGFLRGRLGGLKHALQGQRAEKVLDVACGGFWEKGRRGDVVADEKGARGGRLDAAGEGCGEGEGLGTERVVVDPFFVEVVRLPRRAVHVHQARRGVGVELVGRVVRAWGT